METDQIKILSEISNETSGIIGRGRTLITEGRTGRWGNHSSGGRWNLKKEGFDYKLYTLNPRLTRSCSMRHCVTILEKIMMLFASMTIFDFMVKNGHLQGVAAEGDGLRLLSFEEFSVGRVFSLLFVWEGLLENGEERSLSHASNAEDDWWWWDQRSNSHSKRSSNEAGSSHGLSTSVALQISIFIRH